MAVDASVWRMPRENSPEGAELRCVSRGCGRRGGGSARRAHRCPPASACPCRRVAVRADLDVELGLGGAGPELVAAGAAHVGRDVLGMDLLLHRPFDSTRRLREAPGAAALPAKRRERRKRAGGGCSARTIATQSSSGSVPSIRCASAEMTGASSPARSIACGQQPHGLERLHRLARLVRDLAPPARPRPAARRPCGCASSARARWPPGRRCRPGRRSVRALPPLARASVEHLRGRCPPPPCRRRSGPGPGWRPRPPPRRSWPRRPARPPPGRRRPRTPPRRAGRPRPPGGPAPPSATRTPGPRPFSTISRACAGPPTQATRCGPEGLLERERGRSAVGRHEALGQRHDAGPLATRRAARSSLERLADPLRRHRQEHEVGPRELVVAVAERRAPCSSRGSSTPGEVALVRRASASSSSRLLGACGTSSVVRTPARTSSSATAVPKEPAPTTVTRRGLWPG